MKTKTNNKEQNTDTKLKSRSTAAFHVCSCVFGFSLATLCLLASATGAQLTSDRLDPTSLLIPQLVQPPIQIAKTAQNTQKQLQTIVDIAPLNFAARIDKQLPNGSFIIVPKPGSHLTRQLWKDRITITESENDDKSKEQLKQIIRRIRSVKFQPQQQTPEPAIPSKPAGKTEQNQPESTPEPPEKPRQEKFEPKPPYEPIAAETLQTLTELSQQPDQLENPLALAEVLFLSGHLKEAATFYQLALNQISPEQPDQTQNRPWVLFQIANCLRNSDPAAAMKTYRQLITEHPDSPWTELAKAQDKIIDWYIKEKPMTLIAESQHQSQRQIEYAQSD
ncbi:MAG: tetratricopeptide repeat protein [Planctomycetota bacterium]|jgi:tetratricopeptide (TPR) repeat protein